jgi:DNA-binding CsgD family transcriptional regulator
VSAADRVSLMEGENPDTTHVEDARHWVSIYTQMLEFKERLLERTRVDSEGLPRPAREKVEAEDLSAIERERAKIEQRLQFWRQRHWELAGIDLDAGARTIIFQGAAVDLTHRELQLLEILLRNPNRYISALEILSLAWHDANLAPEQVRSYVTRLRRKLADADIPCRLETRPRRGYRLVFA